MSNLARDAKLHHTGSHSVKEGNTPEGISNNEVFLYFEAIWRGKPVVVTMQADRYSARYWDERTDTNSDKLTPWRVYASEARFGDTDYRGEAVSGNARAALSELCAPLVSKWLESDDYIKSYQRAVARMIMQHFNDAFFAHKRISEALVKFDEVLPTVISRAILAALDAHETYMQKQAKAFAAIEQLKD